jgi:hypothetical protein
VLGNLILSVSVSEVFRKSGCDSVFLFWGGCWDCFIESSVRNHLLSEWDANLHSGLEDWADCVHEVAEAESLVCLFESSTSDQLLSEGDANLHSGLDDWADCVHEVAEAERFLESSASD